MFSYKTSDEREAASVKVIQSKALLAVLMQTVHL